MGIFLDIEGAFDNASYNSIITALENKNFDTVVKNWIHNLLINREAEFKLHDITITKSLNKGVPQGGILSPTLWNFILEDLLEQFVGDPVYIQGYADDVALTVSGPYAEALIGLCNRALTKIHEWGQRNQLKFNAQKTIAILFTTKRNYTINTNLILGNNIIPLSQTKISRFNSG